MRSHVVCVFLALLLMIFAIEEVKGQRKCRMKGSVCVEITDKYGGRCTRMGEERGRDMACHRIGSTCRCKSSQILNKKPPTLHETGSVPGFKANLDVSLSLYGNSEQSQVWTNQNDTEY